MSVPAFERWLQISSSLNSIIRLRPASLKSPTHPSNYLRNINYLFDYRSGKWLRTVNTQQVANKQSISFHHTQFRIVCVTAKVGIKINFSLNIDSHRQKFHSRESAKRAVSRFGFRFFVCCRFCNSKAAVALKASSAR